MAITFSNRAQEIAYRKVADYLTTSALFRDTVNAWEQEPRFEITYGSTRVAVEIIPWDVHPWEGADVAIVRSSSCVTAGSQIGAELMRFLLNENRRMRFGAFHLDDQNRVMFADSVLGGEDMNLMELQTCLLSVVTIADTYDDLIVERFGGQRAVEIGASPV